jgi:hypothetical protein
MDQVSYSFGMKLTTRQYENAMFNVSFKSDIREGEDAGSAFSRVKDWVEEKAHRELVEIRRVYANSDG